MTPKSSEHKKKRKTEGIPVYIAVLIFSVLLFVCTVLWVKDSGRASEQMINLLGKFMSREFKSHIFEAFSRERTSTVSGIQGTGLGMSITKNIVDMMGGTIQVESEAGKGTEFIVTLRLRTSGRTIKFEPKFRDFGHLLQMMMPIPA